MNILIKISDMKKYITLFFAILLAGLTFTSCTRDGDDIGAVVEKRRFDSIAEGHTDEEVLVTPRVVVVAAGIETGSDVCYIRIEDYRAIAVVTVALIFLLPEFAG